MKVTDTVLGEWQAKYADGESIWSLIIMGRDRMERKQALEHERITCIYTHR